MLLDRPLLTILALAAALACASSSSETGVADADPTAAAEASRPSELAAPGVSATVDATREGSASSVAVDVRGRRDERGFLELEIENREPRRVESVELRIERLGPRGEVERASTFTLPAALAPADRTQRRTNVGPFESDAELAHVRLLLLSAELGPPAVAP